jgi:hypothetical protein
MAFCQIRCASVGPILAETQFAGTQELRAVEGFHDGFSAQPGGLSLVEKERRRL